MEIVALEFRHRKEDEWIKPRCSLLRLQTSESWLRPHRSAVLQESTSKRSKHTKKQQTKTVTQRFCNKRGRNQVTRKLHLHPSFFAHIVCLSRRKLERERERNKELLAFGLTRSQRSEQVDTSVAWLSWRRWRLRRPNLHDERLSAGP